MGSAPRQPLLRKPGELAEWPVDRLTPHEENLLIFGEPEESIAYETLLDSVRKNGILEPLVARPDGVLLAGHLRLACAKKAGLGTVPVRVLPAFDDPYDEVVFIVRSNSDRRQLTKREIGLAFKRLREIPRENGGTRGKPGRPRRGTDAHGNTSNLGSIPRGQGRRLAARRLGVSTAKATACERIFGTEGVPDALKAAIERGDVGTIRAAKVIAGEKSRQGGVVVDPKPLLALVPRRETTEGERVGMVEDKERVFDEVFSALLKVYRMLDGATSRLPLAAVVSPEKHEKLRDVLRDIANRAWREIERVEGPAEGSDSTHLTLLDGGQS